jgi:hypothetical protein
MLSPDAGAVPLATAGRIAPKPVAVITSEVPCPAPTVAAFADVGAFPCTENIPRSEVTTPTG